MPVDTVMEVIIIEETKEPDQYVLGWRKIDSDAPKLIKRWLEGNPRTWAYFVHVGATDKVVTVQQYLGKSKGAS